jgi:hypothetical protein
MSRALCPGQAEQPIQRSASKRFFVVTVCGFLLILSACSGEVQLYDPEQAPQDSVPGDVQKATLTLTFQIAIEDSTVSQALGWPEGAVPDAEVIVSRVGSTEELTGMTDLRGAVARQLPRVRSANPDGGGASLAGGARPGRQRARWRRGF